MLRTYTKGIVVPGGEGEKAECPGLGDLLDVTVD